MKKAFKLNEFTNYKRITQDGGNIAEARRTRNCNNNDDTIHSYGGIILDNSIQFVVLADVQ